MKIVKRGFVTTEKSSTPVSGFKINNSLLLKEGVEFNINFYEGVLKRNPYLIDCLKYLGNAYTATGHYDKGLAIDKRLAGLLPYNSEVIYNLACSYSLTHDVDKAISTLKVAIELGYNDLAQIERDKDIDNIRGDARYKEIINNLKKMVVSIRLD